MKDRRVVILSIVSILILACSCPLVTATGVPATQTSAPGAPAASDTPASAASPVPSVAAATSSVPMASPNGGMLNCRSGPGIGWPVVIVLNPGQSAEIAGKSPDGMWWYVKNPSLAGNFCWIAVGFTSTTGDVSGIQVVAVPPTVPVPPTVEAAVTVTDVSVSVDPGTIGVPGCIGPIMPSTINASITTNGAIKLSYHFDTDQNGSLPTHSVKFLGAGVRNVSDNFTPPLTAGTYKVTLVIDGFNLKGMGPTATYKIHC
jgi:uncharacterized protein YraI